MSDPAAEASSPPAAAGRSAFPCAALALTLNAFVWGTSWWPLRRLEALGLHPLWATALIYAVAVVLIVAARPLSLRQLASDRALWWLVLAAGTTNAAFNWAVTIGDVVRVVLLFYLMPLWAVLLARWLLDERLTAAAIGRVTASIAGAAIVLWPDTPASWPLPRSLADALGVLGGFAFAANNVLLRRAAARPEEGRALAMFFGGGAVAGVLALVLTASGRIASPPPLEAAWMLGSLALAAVFISANLALQYGASRLPANVTAVVMLTEVLFASVSALALGAGEMSPALLVGGSLIVGSAVLAAFQPPR